MGGIVRRNEGYADVVSVTTVKNASHAEHEFPGSYSDLKNYFRPGFARWEVTLRRGEWNSIERDCDGAKERRHSGAGEVGTIPKG